MVFPPRDQLEALASEFTAFVSAPPPPLTLFLISDSCKIVSDQVSLFTLLLGRPSSGAERGDGHELGGRKTPRTRPVRATGEKETGSRVLVADRERSLWKWR